MGKEGDPILLKVAHSPGIIGFFEVLYIFGSLKMETAMTAMKALILNNSSWLISSWISIGEIGQIVLSPNFPVTDALTFSGYKGHGKK